MATTIHLTFDDGPHDTFTPAVLDVLSRHGAKATFFQEGRHVERYPELSQLVVRKGHAVGNHAWSHPDLATVDSDQLREELASTSDLIEEVTGSRPARFRPPFGSPFVEMPEHPMAQEIVAQAAALGMATVIWDISTNDWQKPGCTAISSSVIDAPEVIAAVSGLVVLLHDGECADEAENLAALELILSELSARNFVFASLKSA